jgi:hypothetical protein
VLQVHADDGRSCEGAIGAVRVYTNGFVVTRSYQKAYYSCMRTTAAYISLTPSRFVPCSFILLLEHICLDERYKTYSTLPAPHCTTGVMSVTQSAYIFWHPWLQSQMQQLSPFIPFSHPTRLIHTLPLPAAHTDRWAFSSTPPLPHNSYTPSFILPPH